MGDSSEIAPDNLNEHDVDVLQYASQLNLDDEVKGPKIIEKIAGIINKLRLQRITQEQSKAIMKRHNKPENVDVRLPKCEQSIWNGIPWKARVTDVKFQTIQTALLGAINCQLEVANVLLAQKLSKDILTTCLDGITLAMTANYDLNLQRREAMRPQFKPEFAKGLCSSASPADEFLFGGDTAKRVKEINESTKLKVFKVSPCIGAVSSIIIHINHVALAVITSFVEGDLVAVDLPIPRLVIVRIFRVCPSQKRNPIRSLQPTGMLN